MTGLPRLLMVDNNPGDCDLARIALEEARVAVALDTAKDGVQGKAVLERVRDGAMAAYDAVLLDLNMPRMDGRGVLTWARRQHALRDLPIIIFTSSYVAQDRQALLAMGATDYWVKPSNFEEYVHLIAGLRRYLGSDQQASR